MCIVPGTAQEALDIKEGHNKVLSDNFMILK